MIDPDWKDFFPSRILERGRNYCDAGLVRNLQITEYCIAADVSGTYDYEVEIFLDGDTVVEMTCTCPYAEDGTSCKHMAAVLFEVEDTPFSSQISNVRKRTLFQPFPWKETLDALSPDQMREFLADIIEKNLGLQELIVLRYRNQNPEMVMDSWEEQIGEIVRRYSNSRGYIDYVHADDFHSALDDFLLDRVPTLLQANHAMQAFELVSLVFETAMETGADDSGGTLNTLVDSCETFWRDILAISSEQEQCHIHHWFAEHLFTTTWCFGSDFIEDFLFSYDWNDSLLEHNLRLFDQLEKRCEDTDSCLEGILRWREYTMRRLRYTEKEIDLLWHKYRQYSFARNRELNRYMEHQKYEQAIEILLKGKEIDADKPWCVKRHSEKLIELYRITGQTEQYRDELHFQIFNCHQHDMEYIKLLHSTVPESEWNKLYETILTLSTTQDLLYPLLAYGKQWPRLFETIQKKRSLPLLNQYANDLYTWSPNKLMLEYLDLMHSAMYHASDRKSYRSIIGNLPQIIQYPGGEKVVQTLIESWRKQYPRRSAMLDELRAAGY